MKTLRLRAFRIITSWLWMTGQSFAEIPTGIWVRDHDDDQFVMRIEMTGGAEAYCFHGWELYAGTVREQGNVLSFL